MKKAVLSFVVILFACTLVVSAQPAGKKFELGFSGSFTSFKFSYESDSTTVFNLPLRAGYYIWKGLEIEPELMLTKAEGADAGFILAANLAYNFNLKGNLRPFVLAGIGAGFFSPKDSTLEDETKFSAQVGAGTNYRFTDNLLLRLDVRWLATFFDSNGAAFCSGGCVIGVSSQAYSQVQANIGLMFRF